MAAGRVSIVLWEITWLLQATFINLFKKIGLASLFATAKITLKIGAKTTLTLHGGIGYLLAAGQFWQGNYRFK